MESKLLDINELLRSFTVGGFLLYVDALMCVPQADPPEDLTKLVNDLYADVHFGRVCLCEKVPPEYFLRAGKYLYESIKTQLEHMRKDFDKPYTEKMDDSYP